MRGKLGLALVALAILSPCEAQTPVVVNLSWAHPTVYLNPDGTTSPLAVSEITQTRIAFGPCTSADTFTPTSQVIATGGKTTASVSIPTDGYCFVAYTTASGSTAEGVASNIATHGIGSQPAVPRRPGAPTLSAK